MSQWCPLRTPVPYHAFNPSILPLPHPPLPTQTYYSKVQRLFAWCKELETAGNMHMQAVQTLAVDVSAKWRKGVDVATKRKAALQDALTFHINLFEVCSHILHVYLHTLYGP